MKPHIKIKLWSIYVQLKGKTVDGVSEFIGTFHGDEASVGS